MRGRAPIGRRHAQRLRTRAREPRARTEVGADQRATSTALARRLLSGLPQVAPRTPCRRGFPGPSTPIGRRQRFPEPLRSGVDSARRKSPTSPPGFNAKCSGSVSQVASNQRLRPMVLDRKNRCVRNRRVEPLPTRETWRLRGPDRDNFGDNLGVGSAPVSGSLCYS